MALLRELRAAFQPHGFILTVAVSAGKPTIDTAYDVGQVSQNVDIINLMSYDFHGGWESKTAHNAPLHPRPNDNELDREFTLEYAVDYWLKLGADPKKIVTRKLINLAWKFSKSMLVRRWEWVFTDVHSLWRIPVTMVSALPPLEPEVMRVRSQDRSAFWATTRYDGHYLLILT